MINKISLKFGRVPGAEAEHFQTIPITVFVGPNNSGKSQVLREIRRYCSSGVPDPSDVIVGKIDFEGLSRKDAEARIQQVTLPRRSGETLSPDNIMVGKIGNRYEVPRDVLLQALQDPNLHARRFCTSYLVFNTLILDGH